MNIDLRDQLLAMEAEDRRMRAELVADGSLGDGYRPGRSLVGEDVAHAASTPSRPQPFMDRG